MEKYAWKLLSSMARKDLLISMPQILKLTSAVYKTESTGKLITTMLITMGV